MTKSVLFAILDCSISPAGQIKIYELQDFWGSVIGPNFNFSQTQRVTNVNKVLKTLLGDKYLLETPSHIHDVLPEYLIDYPSGFDPKSLTYFHPDDELPLSLSTQFAHTYKIISHHNIMSSKVSQRLYFATTNKKVNPGFLVFSPNMLPKEHMALAGFWKKNSKKKFIIKTENTLGKGNIYIDPVRDHIRDSGDFIVNVERGLQKLNILPSDLVTIETCENFTEKEPTMQVERLAVAASYDEANQLECLKLVHCDTYLTPGQEYDSHQYLATKKGCRRLSYVENVLIDYHTQQAYPCGGSWLVGGITYLIEEQLKPVFAPMLQQIKTGFVSTVRTLNTSDYRGYFLNQQQGIMPLLGLYQKGTPYLGASAPSACVKDIDNLRNAIQKQQEPKKNHNVYELFAVLRNIIMVGLGGLTSSPEFNEFEALYQEICQMRQVTVDDCLRLKKLFRIHLVKFLKLILKNEGYIQHFLNLLEHPDSRRVRKAIIKGAGVEVIDTREFYKKTTRTPRLEHPQYIYVWRVTKQHLQGFIVRCEVIN